CPYTTLFRSKPVRETGQVAKRPRAAVPAVVRQPTGARAPAVTALVTASPVTVAPGVAERAPLARQAPERPPMQQVTRRPSTRLAPRAPAPPQRFRPAFRAKRPARGSPASPSTAAPASMAAPAVRRRAAPSST